MFDRRPQEQQSQQLQQVQQSTSTNTVQSRPSQLVANGAQNSDQSNGSQNFNRPLNLAEPDATTTARTTPLITTTRLILRPVDGLDFSTNTVDLAHFKIYPTFSSCKSFKVVFPTVIFILFALVSFQRSF